MVFVVMRISESSLILKIWLTIYHEVDTFFHPAKRPPFFGTETGLRLGLWLGLGLVFIKVKRAVCWMENSANPIMKSEHCTEGFRKGENEDNNVCHKTTRDSSEELNAGKRQRSAEKRTPMD